MIVCHGTDLFQKYASSSTFWCIVCIMYTTVRDTENLTFSADYCADFLHRSSRCSAVVRVDNWRILRGQLADSARTIGGFRAEQLVDSAESV